MREMYDNYRKEISSKKVIVFGIFILIILGLLFGSLYITILENNEKNTILNVVSNYFDTYKNINFSSKLDIFKHNFISYLVYFIIIWISGLCIIGLPIIFIMMFFKSFITGFSIAGIFVKYKIKGLIGILIYMFPSSIIILFLGAFLACYSSILSIKLVRESFTKKCLNFSSFMGKYFFLLLICILVSVFCALFDAFISPYLYNLYNSVIN